MNPPATKSSAEEAPAAATYTVGISQLVQHVALDPRTAAKVLELSDEIVSRHKLTTPMVTHNTKDATVYSNRLIMMHSGRGILDIAGEETKYLTVEDLLVKFSIVSGQEFASDRALLT